MKMKDLKNNRHLEMKVAGSPMPKSHLQYIIIRAAVRKRHEAKDVKDRGEKRESKLVFIDVYLLCVRN